MIKIIKSILILLVILIMTAGVSMKIIDMAANFMEIDDQYYFPIRSFLLWAIICGVFLWGIPDTVKCNIAKGLNIAVYVLLVIAVLIVFFSFFPNTMPDSVIAAGYSIGMVCGIYTYTERNIV